jgi:YD repeat-containing protein
MLIDEVRLHPQNARMTTYSYDDFGNVTSICDENNEITYREYDEFNRLKLVRDKQNDIVERHTYNLKAN